MAGCPACSPTRAPETFRDRIVLVGGEFAGSGDAHQSPPGRSAAERPVSGLVVQALILNTILDGFPIRESRHWPAIAGVSVVSGVLAFLVLMKRRLTPSLMLATSLVVAYVVAAFSVFAAARILWPVAGPVLSALLALGAALVIARLLGVPPGRDAADVVMLGHALAVASLLLQSPVGVAQPSASPQPVAIVSAIEGGAWTRPKTGSRKPLALYDWLESDAVVELAPKARVDLIMIDGRRYAPRRRRAREALVDVADGAARFHQRGAARAAVDLPGCRSPARRPARPVPCGCVPEVSRGSTRAGHVLTLPDETVLRFEPVEGASQYEIQVRDSTDQQVFSRTIDRPPVAIPPRDCWPEGRLRLDRAGRRRWRVGEVRRRIQNTRQHRRSGSPCALRRGWILQRLASSEGSTSILGCSTRPSRS